MILPCCAWNTAALLRNDPPEVHRMRYILQIFNGAWHTANVSPEDVIRKIREVSSMIAVEKVIIGYHIDPPAYRKIGAELHKSGIQMLLWLPVFSAVSEITEPEAALDIFGKPVVTPDQQAEDGFVFVCPSSGRNIQNVKDIYHQYFSDCGFDGVFLDRIRTQSFVSGVSGVLSCGCSRCREAFLLRGVDIGQTAKRYELLKDSFFDMASWPMNGEFEAVDPAAQRFFEAKEEIISDAVTDLCRYFKDLGLVVGLDLFAPFVSRFVGQNYTLITKYADFIKPMLYRRTNAPAGPGYEFALFKKHAPGSHSPAKLPMDITFLNTQLAAIQDLPCGKYPGIEINYYENIADTDAAYIEESLRAVRDHGLDGAVLCWNIMEAPEAHIKAACLTC